MGETLYSPDYQDGYNAGRASQDARIAELTAELKTLSQQLALLWIDLQGRAPADKLQVIEALANRANAAAALAAVGEKKP